MRVLLLSDWIPPDRGGGAEVMTWQLARCLAQRGHDVHLATTTRERAQSTVRDGVQVHTLHATCPERFQPWVALWNPQVVPHLGRLYRRLSPDVVHAHNIHNALSFGAVVTASRLGVPTVVTCQDLVPICGGKLDAALVGYRTGAAAAVRVPAIEELRRLRFRYNPFRRRGVRHVLARHARARTCVSETQRGLLEANGFDGFEVIPNAVDPLQFAGAHDAGGGGRVILFGGRVGTAKGAGVLGRAFLRVARDRADVGLLVLSRHRADLSALWPEAGDDPRVRHAGWLDGPALAAAYRRAAIAVVPSLHVDAGPITALEAMAASCPVVASPYGGLSEYVEDGVTGVLVRPDDTESFAGVLGALLDDEARRRAMGAAGRARVLAHYAIDDQVARYLAVYERVVAGRGGTQALRGRDAAR